MNYLFIGLLMFSMSMLVIMLVKVIAGARYPRAASLEAEGMVHEDAVYAEIASESHRWRFYKPAVAVPICTAVVGMGLILSHYMKAYDCFGGWVKVIAEGNEMFAVGCSVVLSALLFSLAICVKTIIMMLAIQDVDTFEIKEKESMWSLLCSFSCVFVGLILTVIPPLV